MSSLVLTGDTSGTITVAAPAVAGTNTLTLQAVTGTVALQADVIGIGQTWQNLSASRAAATTYTNSSGRPITVFIMGGSSASNSVIIGGLTTQTFAAFVPVTFIVPNGDTYRIASVNSGVFWLELR